MRMSRRPVKALLALSITTLVFAQDPVIRVNVNLVRAIATVRNMSGELVGSLQKEDFEIFDNGVRQEVAIFGRQTEQPLSIALMLDTSGSVAKDFKSEVDSAVKFLRAYDVGYVIVGQVERLYYPPAGIDKFASGLNGALEPVYKNPSLTIYKVRPEP